MKNLCYCVSCQKCIGNVFGSFAGFQTNQVTITETEPSVLRTYDDTSSDSGEVIKRSFCGRCGSPVKAQRQSSLEAISVPVGIIDGDKTALKPEMEFYCRGRASWLGAVDGATRFDTMPSVFPSIPSSSSSTS